MSDFSTASEPNPSLSRAEAPMTLQGEDGAAGSGAIEGSEPGLEAFSTRKDETTVSSTEEAGLRASPRPTLRPYQEEARDFLLERNRAIEGDAPGIGKTATVICSLAARDPQPSPVLVLAPLSVVRHWEAEMGRWSGYRAVVGVGSAAQRREARGHILDALSGFRREPGSVVIDIPEKPVAYITNYEAAKADAADLYAIGWKAVVADEVHRARNRKTKLFKTLRQLALPSPVFVGISGTPIVNQADDLWALLHLVDPKNWSSYWTFVNTMMDTETTTFNGKLAFPVKQVKGLRPGMDGVLRQHLRDVMIRRSLQQLLPELPEIVETVYEVDLSDGERKVYDDMKARFFADLPDGSKVVAPNDVAKMTRLRQLANDWSVLGASDETSTKVKRLYELLEDIGDEQVVIFSAFSKVLDPIAAKLCAGKITGDVKSNDRTDVIRAFKEGALQYVCGTIKAMGEGIDLQTARHAVFLDLEWSPSAQEQCIARIHRYGQSSDAVFVHILAARGTVDAYIAKTLSNKQNVIDAVVGKSWVDVLSGSGITSA